MPFGLSHAAFTFWLLRESKNKYFKAGPKGRRILKLLVSLVSLMSLHSKKVSIFMSFKTSWWKITDRVLDTKKLITKSSGHDNIVYKWTYYHIGKDC